MHALARSRRWGAGGAGVSVGGGGAPAAGPNRPTVPSGGGPRDPGGMGGGGGMAGPRLGVGGWVAGLPTRVGDPRGGCEEWRAGRGARGGRRMAVGLMRVGCGCLRADRRWAVESPAGVMPVWAGGVRRPHSECRRALGVRAGRDGECRRPDWVWGGLSGDRCGRAHRGCGRRAGRGALSQGLSGCWGCRP